MKIEKIADGTIRVTLAKSDFKTRDIDESEVLVNSSEFQKLLLDILDHAVIELGTSLEEGQFLMETSNSTDGEYIITISNTLGDSNLKLSRLRDFASNGKSFIAEKIKDYPMPIEDFDNNSNTEDSDEFFDSGYDDSGDEKNDHLNDAIDGFDSENKQRPNSKPHIREVLRGSKGDETRLYMEAYNDGNVLLMFNDINNLINFVSKNKRFQAIDSELFIHKSVYYILFKPTPEQKELVSMMEIRCMDYGAVFLPSFMFTSILCEYACKIIPKNAAKRLADKFK